jgi:hypothetical protein
MASTRCQTACFQHEVCAHALQIKRRMRKLQKMLSIDISPDSNKQGAREVLENTPNCQLKNLGVHVATVEAFGYTSCVLATAVSLLVAVQSCCTLGLVHQTCYHKASVDVHIQYHVACTCTYSRKTLDTDYK